MLAPAFGYKSGVVKPFCIGLMLLCLAGCRTGGSPPDEPLRQLTAALRLSGAAEMSRLSYQDACGTRRDFALGLALRDGFQGTLAETFAEAGPAGPTPTRPDRVIEVDLDAAEMILFVEKGAAQRYPVTVALSVVVTAVDAAGTPLEQRRLETSVGGTVYTEADRCAVVGVEGLASEAVETLSEDFGGYLTASQSIAFGTVSPEAPASATALTFRARLLDADGDRILQGEERVTLEVEVTNAGRGRARDVRARVSGSGELVRRLPPVIVFGDLQPGESKRQSVTTQLGRVAAGGQAELVLSLESSSSLRPAPARKKFLIILQPKQVAAEATARLGSRGGAGNTLTARNAPG